MIKSFGWILKSVLKGSWLGVKGGYSSPKYPPIPLKRIINKNIKFWLSLFDVGG
ncbi:hypothetical protein HPYSS1_01527 [Helicobacter pylori SS1]|nr:hypothetical protein HPSS1190_06669 [Helicobacter pylori SS1_190]KAF1000592.1 hypothetical protein HPYSS1_01527 [Helicobacter pylori SS1]